MGRDQQAEAQDRRILDMIIATIAALVILFGGGSSLENYLLDIKKPVKDD